MSESIRIEGKFFAPPLGAGDERPVALVRAIERLWPGERMIYELARVPGKRYQYREIVHEHDRDAWLTGGGEAFPSVSNGRRTLEDGISASSFVLADDMASGGVAQLQVSLDLPLREPFIARVDELAVAAARALDAWWGMLSPSDAHLTVVHQITPIGGEPRVPPGLPELLPQPAGPALPHYLGWVNVWSDAARSAAGPSDATAPAVSRDGVWLLRLTDEPLGLSRPEHFAALQRAYAAYPGVGRIPL